MAFTEAVPSLHSSQETHTPITEDTHHTGNESQAHFQAVGVIVGDVHFLEFGNTMTIGRTDYPLFYIAKKRRAFESLKREIEKTGNHRQRLVVYPKVIHFPNKDQPHVISFQVVGFDTGREAHAISSELGDNEFKLSGLWQFIPVCPTPCISVFRNFTPQRLEFMKHAEPAQNVKFMKASHVPTLWKDAPVKPFRFNPKAEGDQGHPAFVAIKAKFLPHRNIFGFVDLLAPPQEKAPRFLKLSKDDQAAVQAAKKQKS